MGRPPVGKTAMTGAERQRRYWLKHGKAKPITKPVSDGGVARLRQELKMAQGYATILHQQVMGLKAELAAKPKTPKPKLDPESEAAQELERVKAVNASLRKQIAKLKRAIPFSMRAKIAKALTETTTNPALRLETLQAWNGLGVNSLW